MKTNCPDELKYTSEKGTETLEDKNRANITGTHILTNLNRQKKLTTKTGEKRKVSSEKY